MDAPTINPKQQLIIAISIVFIVLVSILINVAGNQQKEDAVQKYVEMKQKELDKSLSNSQKKIDSLIVLINANQKKLEELQTQKDQIKLIYVRQDAKIDTLNYSGIVDMFKDIFARGGIN